MSFSEKDDWATLTSVSEASKEKEDDGPCSAAAPTTFSPDSPVTRGQLATFLWRFAGEPVV